MGLHERQKTRQKRKNKGGKHLAKKHPHQAKNDVVVNRFMKVMSIVMLVFISISIVSVVISLSSSSTASTYEDADSSTFSEDPLAFIASNREQKQFFIGVMLANSIELQSIDPWETIDSNELFQLYDDFIANLKAEDRRLLESYDTLIAQIDEFLSHEEEFSLLYDSVKEARVCSKANKFNNSLQESYAQMQEKISAIKELYAQYEADYVVFKQNVDDFNSGLYLSSLVEIQSPQELHDLYMRFFFGTYGPAGVYSYTPVSNSIEELNATFEEFSQYEEKLSSIATDSQKIADDFFNEVFYDASHIANAEAGTDWFPPEDIYWVLNVIENRMESPLFKQTTMHDVIFAPGQYSPTWTGSFYLEPTDQVKERVTTYLRGYVETGMPSDVVYQAGFEQGDYIWKVTESGILFCGVYGA